MIVDLVSRYLTNYLIIRMPIFYQLIFNKYLHAEPLYYTVLVRFSTGYPIVEGRLHTCYSPVRRSPPSYCYSCAAPRLACVRPVASVHPEPGSNSSLYLLYSLLYLRSVTWPNWLLSLFFYCTTLASSIPSMNFSLQRRPRGLPVLRKCCKDTAFPTYNPNFSQCFFWIIFLWNENFFFFRLL